MQDLSANVHNCLRLQRIKAGQCSAKQPVTLPGHSIQAAVTFHGLLHSRPRRVESVRGNGYDGRMSAEEAELVSGIISSCLKAQGRTIWKRDTPHPPQMRQLRLHDIVSSLQFGL